MPEKIDIEKIGYGFGKWKVNFPISKKDFMSFAEDVCNDMLLDSSKDMSDIKDALIQKSVIDSGQDEGDDFEEAYSNNESIFSSACAKGITEKLIEKGITFNN